MELTAIIVSYNVKHYLAQCILSLFKSCKDIEIIVADNNSHDDTQTYLQRAFPHEYGNKLKFIANKENLGFGKANNLALRHAQGDYILFINPDTFVGEDTIPTCLSFLQTHPDAGIIGTRMLNANGSFAKESRRAVPTPLTSFYKLCGMTSLFPYSRIFGKYYMQYLDATEICKIDVVSGAFMMTRRNILAQYGAFDEDFFMYGEDIELSYRILLHNYQNYYLPTRILHYKGESTNKASQKYINDFYMAMLIFFRKYHPKSKLLYAIIFLSVYLLSFKALLTQWCVKLRNKLRTSKHPQAKYIFWGSAEMIEQAKQISANSSLESTYHISEDNNAAEPIKSALTSSTPTYIVYDMSIYSYADILRTFDDMPKNNLMMAMFHPGLRLMLTNEDTFSLNK